MRVRLLPLLAGLALVAGPATARAQVPAGDATLRVTVQDETRSFLIHATVTIVAADLSEATRPVDDRGVAAFERIAPGAYTVRAAADGFQTLGLPVTVRRGNNQTTFRLSVLLKEEILVNEEDAASRRDNGFTTTLSEEELDALSDDPEEMAEELMQMAGAGGQIFVDGFRGGRLPPKDQIQQIRFRRNSFSAEYHDAGMVRIEVITKPGMGNWRGRANFGFRDESLNARNAFAPERGAEQQKRYSFNFSGPLVQGKTSLRFEVDGLDAFESQTIVAATPTGGFNSQVRQPTDRLNVSTRLDQALGEGHNLQLEYQRRTNDRRNLGVGDFDLAERAYAQEDVTDTLRVRNTRVLGKSAFSELKIELRQRETTLESASLDPTIRVLDAFTAGGAGQSGVRSSRELMVSQDVDWGVGSHNFRAGALVEASWWDSTDQRNANGTFTFRSLADFQAGRPSQYSRRVGDPEVSYTQVELGYYVQDDFKIGRDLSLSLGVRHEMQTHLDDYFNLAPRAGVSWTPRGTKWSMRGGWGLFYDWYEASLHEQTVRVDGTRQLEQVIVNPTWPDPFGAGAGSILPPGIIRAADLSMPTIQQASVGFERPLTGWMDMRGDYMWQRGTSVLRSVNANAPVNGVRPDPSVGNITEIESTGKSAVDRLTLGLNLRVPSRRMFGHFMYQLGSQRNSADSALSLPSDSTNPDADWGPARNDMRHRLFLMFNTPLVFGVRAGLTTQIASGMPYTITTGRDDNGDTVFNDRPAGVGRNTERGAVTVNTGLRLNKSFPLGGIGGGGMGGPIGDVSAQRGPGGGDGPQIMVREGVNSRASLDLHVQIQNLFNTTNFLNYVGNQLSPFFGQATAAQSARRVELGVSVSF